MPTESGVYPSIGTSTTLLLHMHRLSGYDLHKKRDYPHMKTSHLLCFLALWLSTKASFAETIINITNGEWEPYLSEFSYEYGLASHIISEAYKLEGIKVKWGFFPWKRAYEAAKDGQTWNASAVWWPTDEAKASFLITDPVINTSFVFFHLKTKKFDWKKVEDLKGLAIGVTRGYDYGKPFMEAVENKQLIVDEVSADELNYKKLLKGRIDLFPNDPIVGEAQIRNSLSSVEAQLLTHHPMEFAKNTLNLIISKKSKNGKMFLEKLNSGMMKLKKSGKLDQMFRDLRAGKYDKQKTIWHKSSIDE